MLRLTNTVFNIAFTPTPSGEKLLTVSPHRPWLPPPWTTVDDGVRGGSSTSHLASLPGNCAVFHGQLDTTTLGGAGFASQFSPVDLDRVVDVADSSEFQLAGTRSRRGTYPTWDLSEYAGLELSVLKMDSKTYTLILKDTEDTDDERDDGRKKAGISWEARFKDSSEAQGGVPLDSNDVKKFWIPWASFEATYRGKKVEDAGPLNKGEIIKVGLMMRRFVMSAALCRPSG
ncbi:MAG: hypothetical protein LQ342_001650 [Letrouitia transgressa]|nr:MAG: hypothetical protein LQ342_001650 [Letrouitia transgressa]